MLPRLFTICSLLALTALAPVAGEARESISRTLTHRHVTIEGDGTTGPYALGETLILEGSEEIRRGDRKLIPGLDYELDHARGEFTLSQPLLAGQQVAVLFEVLPFRLAPVYFHREPLTEPRPAETSGGELGAPIGVPASGGVLEPAGASLAGLSVGGSKTMSLGIGTGRDLAVDQELNLTITGSLTPEVEVRALLSDRDLPLQPEGTSRELDRLDQVRVEIRSPRVEVGLGDYEIRLGKAGQFAQLARELEGVQTLVRGNQGTVHAGVALAKGRFRRQELMGVEGRQGPYVLTDENGTEGVVVLAGSEKVWLDGAVLTRGEENDYVIDYSRGRLEFTRRHLITADSRVAVDFEYSNESFRRNLLFARTENEAYGGRLSWGTTVLHETDDSDRPRGPALTEEERSILADTGDEDVWAPGWESAGEGAGDYDLGADSILVYQPEEGDYRVRFTFVGEGEGDYRRRFDEERFRYYFEWDPGGDYTPFVRLRPPARLTLADVHWDLAPRRWLSLAGEVAASRHDRNLLSTLEDWDNDDRALALTGELRGLSLRWRGRSLGRLSATGRLRDVGPHFAAPGSYQPVFYGADWNLQGGTDDAAGLGGAGEERMREIMMEYAPGELLRISAGAGELERPPETEVRRWELGGELGWPRGGVLTLRESRVRTERADTAGVARVTHLAFQHRRGPLSSRLAIAREVREDRTGEVLRRGFAFGELGGQVEVTSGGTSRVGGEFRVRRNREVREAEWRPRSTSRQAALEGELRRGPGSLKARLSRRVLSYETGAEGADSKSDGAELALRDMWGAPRLSTEFTYRITQNQVETQERRFVRAGDGADYDSLGRYTPGEGEFAPIRVPTGLEPVATVELTSRLRWSAPHRAGEEWSRKFFRTLLGSLGGETYLSVEEQSRETDRTALYLFRPRVLQADETSLFGRIVIRQDVSLPEGRGPLAVRLRLLLEEEKDRRVVNRLLGRRVKEGEVRLRSAPRPGLTVETRIRRRNTRAVTESTVLAGREDILSHQLELTTSYQATSLLSLSFGMRGDTNHERVSDRRLSQVELAPRVSYSLFRRGRVEGELRWRRSREAEGPALPVSGLGLIRRSGWEWRLSWDYRLSRFVQATLRYAGEALHGRSTEHRGSADLRAYF